MHGFTSLAMLDLHSQSLTHWEGSDPRMRENRFDSLVLTVAISELVGIYKLIAAESFSTLRVGV